MVEYRPAANRSLQYPVALSLRGSQHQHVADAPDGSDQRWIGRLMGHSLESTSPLQDHFGMRNPSGTSSADLW